MSEKANWTVQVQIQGNKPLNLNGQMQADGFEKMSPSIPAADGKTPGSKQVPVDAGASLLVVSTADKSGKLTVAFSSGDGQKTSAAVPLTQDAPIFLLGKELIASQVDGGANTTATLSFSNASTEEAPVDILVLGDLP
jgi:hypothetical protein